MALFRTVGSDFFLKAGHYIVNDMNDNSQTGVLSTTAVTVPSSASRGTIIINTEGVSSIILTPAGNMELIGCAYNKTNAVTPSAFKTTLTGAVTVDVSNYDLMFFTVAAGGSTVTVAKAS